MQKTLKAHFKSLKNFMRYLSDKMTRLASIVIAKVFDIKYCTCCALSMCWESFSATTIPNISLIFRKLFKVKAVFMLVKVLFLMTPKKYHVFFFFSLKSIYWFMRCFTNTTHRDVGGNVAFIGWQIKRKQQIAISNTFMSPFLKLLIFW